RDQLADGNDAAHDHRPERDAHRSERARARVGDERLGVTKGMPRAPRRRGISSFYGGLALALVLAVVGCGGRSEPTVRLQLRLEAKGSGSDVRLSCRPDRAEGLADPRRACRSLPSPELQPWSSTRRCPGSAYAARIRGRYDGHRIAIQRCDKHGVQRLIHTLRWTSPAPS